MKKILLISNMYPSLEHPIYGIFVKNFIEQVNDDEITISGKAVIYGRGKNILEKILKYIKFFKDVIHLVKKGNYDLIYVHYVGHSLLPLLFLKKQIQKKAFIINAHGSDVLVNSKIEKYIQRLVLPIIKMATLIVVPSDYFKNIVIEKFDIEENKVFTSPSGGLNTKLFKNNDNKTNNKIFTIGYVSRIDQGKGWDILLKAVSRITHERKQNIRVLIIGGGAQESLLLQMIKDLNLEDYVKFFGAVPQIDLIKYYAQMDIFIFPTTRLAESLGLVGLEAMACGTPVIGSDIGGLKGYIKNGYNGQLFEPGNSEQLSEIIDKFINMREDDINIYSQNAIQTSKEYDSEIVSRKLKAKLLDFLK